MGVELWVKPYIIKLRCYWEHIGDYIWEHWELDGNTLGTREKNKKSLSPLSPLKKKKTGLFMRTLQAFALAAWISLFKFVRKHFAWANAPSLELGYLFTSPINWMWVHWIFQVFLLFHVVAIGQSPKTKNKSLKTLEHLKISKYLLSLWPCLSFPKSETTKI